MSNELKKTKREEPKVKAETIHVYIGPSLPDGRLKAGTVFKGQKTEVLKHLEAATTKHPEVISLIVPVGEVASAKRKLQAGDSLLSEKYKALQKRIK